MPSYITLTTLRTTIPDQIALLVAVKAVTDSSAVLTRMLNNEWRGKKATTWTLQQISDVQNVLDTIPALTSQLEAQRIIDIMPLWEKSAFLVVLDRFNLIATKLSPPIAEVTPVQFIQAIRNKAGTL